MEGRRRWTARAALRIESVVVPFAAVVAIALSGDLLWSILVAAWHGRPMPVLLDFNCMMLGGEAARDGILAKAYSLDWMRVADRSLGLPFGQWLPYTYPPTAALVFAPLSLLSTPIGFLVFEAAGLWLFLAGVKRVSPSGFRTTLVLAAVPISVLNIRSGQNGLWTAGLAAFAAHAWIDGRSGRAGMIAALITGKPHVALGLPLAFVWTRDWRGAVAFVAAAVAIVLASVVAFGISPWIAYPAAMRLVGRSLAAGLYPMSRFSSGYAAAYGLGLRGGAAMAVQVGAMLLVSGACAVAAWRQGEKRVVAALAIVAASFVSPYAYDYDLAMLSVSAALLAPLLVERAGVHVAANLLATLVVGQFAGLTWWSFDGRGGIVFFVVAPTVLVAVGLVVRLQRARGPCARRASTSFGSPSAGSVRTG